MENQPIIEFQDFTFQYYAQSEPTLHDLNIRIMPGEKILIVGPSGSGKSTIGHCLNGLIPFSYRGESKGGLTVKGLETKDLDIFQLSKIVGTVLQDSDGQFVGLTVGEDIAFALENDNVPNESMRQRVDKVSRMVGMQDHLRASPFELSGGQKQRTSLAGVMIDDVDILLFDEPLANLDPATGKTAIEIIDDIYQQSGKTIIIIEHRLEEVLHRPIDRILVINDGRIVADLPPHELIASGVLGETGIREPLYVAALRYAGVTIEANKKPAYISSIELGEVDREKVITWQREMAQPPVRVRGEPLLSLEHVDFSYDGVRQVLHDISFTLNSGEMVSLVGKNGAGKSTLAKLLVGFIKPDRGVIKFHGKDIREQTIRERAEYIGYVMQNPNQMISKPMIRDEVALGLQLRHVDPLIIEERVKHALQVCGLAPFEDWPISALSYGQKKRVTIASILALQPKILVLDEPTAGQDYRHYTEIMEFLLELNRQGITIMFITHDMHLMLEYTPRAIVLADGHLVADTRASVVLTDRGIIDRANLSETSLYQLANRMGIADGTAFVQNFIDFDRQRKAQRHES